MHSFGSSYIDALIKLERLADAKAVFDQAKSKGAKGDGFDKLEKRLDEARKDMGVNVTPKSCKNHLKKIQLLIDMYTQGEYQQALNNGSHWNSFQIYQSTTIGASSNRLGKLDEAIEAYKKLLSIKPDYAEAYYNMGNTLKEKEKLEAIEAYKALAIKLITLRLS